LCIDYCKLDVITVKNKSAMPRIEERLDKFGLISSRYFIGLDLGLASGYYQILVIDSIERTVFVTQKGIMNFCVCPSG